MKLHAFVLSLSLLFFSYTTQAQYESMFGTSHTSWNVLTTELAGNILDSLVACCDTTVNGYDYKLIQRYGYAGYWWAGPVNQGLLREDTTTGEAWFLSLGDHLERKVSDMTLAVGDSFAVYNLNTSVPSNDSVVVDSVYYINGRKYIRLDIVPFYHHGDEEEKVKLIEGVGPNIGVYYGDLQFAVHAPYLLCAHKDGQQVYQNSNGAYGNYCNSLGILYNVDNVKRTESAIKSYPNPFSESITLEYEEGEYPEKTTITIYNVSGQKVMTEQWTSGSSKTIATAALPIGFYFILVRNQAGALLYSTQAIRSK